MRIRCSGVSVGVIARKAGTTASGSTMTKSELEASKMYSGKVTVSPGWIRCSNGAWRENGISHAVNDLLIGRTDGGQHATEIRARGFGFPSDKIVRAEADAAFHRNQLIAFEIKPLGLGEAGLVIALENMRRMTE